MARADVGEVELDYEVVGEGEPLLMISGVGMQRVVWPEGLVQALVGAGFQVVTFDNRDLGRSTWLDHLGPPPRLPFLARALVGLPVKAPYTLREMAADSTALLDHLGLERAHVLGASMGGMIAQRMAIHRPGRVKTLISIMSSPWARHPPGRLRAEASLALARPPRTAAEAEDNAVALFRKVGSPGFPHDEEGIRRRARLAFDRGVHPEGFLRQMAATLADGNRTSALAQVSAPTLVLHGTADPLVPPEAATATALAIPGARLQWIAGMGHDLPPGAFPILVDAIAAHAKLGT